MTERILRSRTILFDGAFYAIAHYFSATLAIAAGFLVRLWVPPALFGATNIITAIQDYCRSVDGTFRNSLDREVPILRGERDTAGQVSVIKTAYSLLLASALVESAAFVIAGLLAGDVLLRFAWWVFAAANTLDALNTTDRILLKARLQFRTHNRLLARSGIVSSATLVTLSWAWGAHGYLSGLLLGAFLVFAYSRSVMGREWLKYFTLRLPSQTLRRVLGVGASVTLLKLAQQLLLTVDRYIVASYLGLQALGYYSLGTMLGARVSQLPLTLAGSYAPRLNEQLGTGDWHAARGAAERVHVASAAVSACTTGLAVLLVRLVLQAFLPEYLQAASAIEMMLLGTFFVSANGASQQVHIGANRMTRASLFALLGSAVTFAGGWLLVGKGLKGVAIARVVGLGGYALALEFSAQRVLKSRVFVSTTLAGFAAVGILYALLVRVGPRAGWLWLAAYTGGSIFVVSKVLKLEMRRLPRMILEYLRQGERTQKGRD